MSRETPYPKASGISIALKRVKVGKEMLPRMHKHARHGTVAICLPIDAIGQIAMDLVWRAMIRNKPFVDPKLVVDSTK